MNEINQRVRDTLDGKGLTDAALCKNIKVAKSTFSNWMTKDRSIPAEKIVPICEFLGVSLDYLLKGQEAENLHIAASNIHNSAIVQGNHATTLIVRNGKTEERMLADQEVELLRIYNSVSVKNRISLLSFAYEIEEGEKSTKK